jgi:hypothetical protein
MRFLRVVIVVWLLLTALIIAAMFYGYSDEVPNELRELGFDRCDGHPCFLGIVPGITSGKEAYQLLSQYDETLLYVKGRPIIARVNDIDFAVHVDDMDQILIIHIPVYSGNEFPQLKSFIALYGVPCAVHAAHDQPTLGVNYPGLALGSYEVQGRLSLYSDLSYVALLNPEIIPPRCAGYENEGFSIKPWRGFILANRYKPN